MSTIPIKNINGQSNITVNQQAQILIDGIGAKFKDRKKCFIVVSHVLSNITPFLNTLSKNGRLVGFVAKPNSIESETYKAFVDMGIDFLDITKQDLFLSATIQQKISPIIKDDESLVIIDTGGYFANALPQLNQIKNILGIVEDTENGLQKYEKALSNFPDNKVPIYSVARSKVKTYEDYLVGRAIAEITLEGLKYNNVPLEDKKIGVIGFGEIGRGAAFYLKDYKRYNVQVYDVNPSVETLAIQNGFKAVRKEEILKSSDILICATGNKSLSDNDLNTIKKGCFISSCTSSDDEFAFENINIADGIMVGNNLRNVNGIFFLNDGNSINFIDTKKQSELLSPYVYLTHSSLLACCIKLDNNEVSNLSMVNVLSSNDEDALISAFHDIMEPDNENAKFIQKIVSSDLGKHNERKCN